MVCAACGNVSYRNTQISEHELAVASAIREMEGLLSPAELLSIRLKYRLKQTDMEQMLSTGPKTWTRWERGKIPQSKAADQLIRLIADDPDIAHRLMVQAGINNAEATATFEQELCRNLGDELIRRRSLTAFR
jgi:putative zinc finger/helix-turn-helix YgiT family protein